MINERELFLDAVKNLKILTRRDDITIMPSDSQLYDTDVCIGEVKFMGEVKSYVNSANFNQMLLRLQKIRSISEKPVLLIVGSISPQNLIKFADEGINVLDCAGNCYINTPLLFIFTTGQKQTKPQETVKKVFNDSALKLIFYFLLDLGVLFRMSCSYSSCACLMPVSPVTVLTVTKGSSRRSLS